MSSSQFKTLKKKKTIRYSGSKKNWEKKNKKNKTRDWERENALVSSRLKLWKEYWEVCETIEIRVVLTGIARCPPTTSWNFSDKFFFCAFFTVLSSSFLKLYKYCLVSFLTFYFLTFLHLNKHRSVLVNISLKINWVGKKEWFTWAGFRNEKVNFKKVLSF